MGLFGAVLTLPLAPVRGVMAVAGWVGQAADRETRDPAAVRARLVALNEDLENGLIDEDVFEREEDRLLDLLEDPQAVPTGAVAALTATGDGGGGARTAREHEVTL